MSVNICQCGCNEPVRITKYYISKFKRGHNNKNRKHNINKRGNYFVIKRPHHKYAMKDGYVLLHRYLKELDIGRYLKPYELVHHIDENTHNNEPNNLEIVTRSTHKTIHLMDNKYGVKNMSNRICLICNSNTTYLKDGKYFLWIKFSNGFICHTCYQKYVKLRYDKPYLH